MAYALWDHQEELIRRFGGQEELLAYAGCGVGKTLSVLDYVRRSQPRFTLVLTLKNAMRSVWDNEIKERTPDLRSIVLDQGTAKDKNALLQALQPTLEPTVVTVNYHTAKLLELDRIPWNLVVADESHKLKANTSDIAVKLTEMLANVPQHIAMTGTMWEDRYLDLYGQMRWIRPELKRGRWISRDFGYFTRFFDEYVVYRRDQNNVKIPKGYQNVDRLKAIIQPYIVQITREDANLHLPPVRDQTIKVRMNPGQRKVYNSLRKHGIVEIDQQMLVADNILVKGLRLHQLAAGHYTIDPLNYRLLPRNENPKIEALNEIVDSLGDEPFVVYAAFREDIAMIREALTALEITNTELSGKIDNHMAWQQGKYQALVVQVDAGSASVNLTRAAYGIYYTIGHSRTNYVQSRYRIDRPGQTRPVLFYHLVVENSVDEIIYDALEQKGEHAEDLRLRLTEHEKA